MIGNLEVVLICYRFKGMLRLILIHHHAQMFDFQFVCHINCFHLYLLQADSCSVKFFLNYCLTLC